MTQNPTNQIRRASPDRAIQLLLEKYIKEVDTGTDRLRLIILGEYGTGKTCCAMNCRFPVLLDSFDPGGTTSRLLTPYIKDHRILRMPIFERESLKTPKAFELYQAHFTKLINSGIFSKIGTYYPDSLTNLGDIIMYKVLHDDGKDTTDKPEWKHYLKQQLYLISIVKQWTALPCDVVTTGHIIPVRDEETDRTYYNMMITGKLSVKIPLLFNEIFIMLAKRTSTGTSYQFQTTSDNKYKARTRMGAGIYKKYEEANIKKLLKRADRPHEDLPLLTLNKAD